MGTGGSANDGGVADGGRVDGGSSDGGILDGSVTLPVVDGSAGGRLAIVRIVDAVIAPIKSDGTSWDPGGGGVPAGLSQELGNALSSINPEAAVASLLLEPTVKALSKPDAYGTAQATVYGMITPAVYLAAADAAVQDNFTPIWPATWNYQNIPIDTDVRISITLFDADLLDSDDPIGSAEINSADLRAALAAQKKLEVKVSDQTNGQLLFIGISVTEQAGSVK